ncbi:MAG: DUF2267 domain-containing protein [Thermoleophilia bacterium]
MSEHNFLKMIKQRGRYGTQGEAARAANAVFGTVKAWLSPSAAADMRKVLPGDAEQLWRYSPVTTLVAPVGGKSSRGASQSLHFILRVQQLGSYHSSTEARRAACSVFSALAGSLPVEPSIFLGQVFPPEIMGACRAGSASWAA